MSAIQSAATFPIPCVHCGVPQRPRASFCESCGKALPQPRQEPRIIEDETFADTRVGQSLQSDELSKHIKTAATALLVVAIIQAVTGTILAVAIAKENGPIVFVVMGFIAAIFFALYAWARRNPLPATVCGLVVFVTLHALDALVDPTMLFRGLLVKLIIVSLLVRGITASLKHRELLSRME